MAARQRAAGKNARKYSSHLKGGHRDQSVAAALRPRSGGLDQSAVDHIKVGADGAGRNRVHAYAFETVTNERLGRLAVEGLDRQLGRVDVVQAARIDRHHGALGALPASEGTDAADFAEEMVDVSVPELVVRQRLLAFFQLERRSRDERKQSAGAPTDRAIALRDRSRQIDVDGVPDRSAVTSACNAARASNFPAPTALTLANTFFPLESTSKTFVFAVFTSSDLTCAGVTFHHRGIFALKIIWGTRSLQIRAWVCEGIRKFCSASASA